MRITIYVEGGGETSRTQSQCREAFRKLLESSGFATRMPAIIACGGRGGTYRDFAIAHQNRRAGEFPILLVDSEEVPHEENWPHLCNRDGWEQPQGCEGDQVQLMIACMETWVMADRPALRRIFGAKLRINALLPLEGLEQRSKGDIQDALENATRDCGRDRCYKKGRRSFQVVRELDPRTLALVLEQFARLVSTLEDRLD